MEALLRLKIQSQVGLGDCAQFLNWQVAPVPENLFVPRKMGAPGLLHLETGEITNPTRAASGF